jgi:DeoR/GlpR family transcriptional regulator of sugar metabolism
MEETAVGKELIQIGARRMIFRQIARRFGTVPVTIRRQIEKIDKIKQLERIADGLLEVKDLKQLRKLVGPNGKFA